MSKELHVIFGTGPVGCWIARAIAEMKISVRAVNRSGRRPQLLPIDTELVAADLSNTDQATTAAKGATVIYQALNPPYHQWHRFFPELQSAAITAAQAVSARFVSIENLYMLDSTKPMNEESPVAPRSKKGELRARMAEEVMTAHRQGKIRAAALRSSDYYGPGVLGSALGERVFGSLLSGKKAQVGGSADLPHSFAYIEDVGKAAATIGLDEKAFGQVWITPHDQPRTQGEMVAAACRLLGCEPKMAVISPAMMRLVGPFVPGARASVEMMYEFTEPFIVDSHRMQQVFSLPATPIDTGIEKTINWYQNHYRR